MTRRKWALITAVLVLTYGAFLLFQAFWPGWTMVQSGSGLNIAKVAGGIILLGWGSVFFRLKG